tara:strand:- start:4854 stop:5534 length:681 start_codon:yes stop_codon:yes gene_type:complete
MEASGNMSCNATPQIVKSKKVQATMGGPSISFETGYFDIEHLDKHGNVKSKFRAYNGTTQELATEVFNLIDPDSTGLILGQSGRTANIVLFSNSAANTAPTLLTSDTYATGISGTGASFHTGTFNVETGWTDADANGGLTWGVAADGTGTGNFTLSGTTTKSFTNTNPTGFTGLSASNVVGAAVYAENSGGTDGVLLASAAFSSGIATVATDDTVNVTFTMQLVVT